MKSLTERLGALLPDRLYAHHIEDMAIGEKGYTVLWAMMVDMDGRCHLCGTYMVKSSPAGTAYMLVSRNDDGWHVRLTEHRYHTSKGIPWCGATKEDLIPVSTLYR